MNEDETKELYTNPDTAVLERMSIPEKLGEQRAYGKANFSKIEQNEKAITDMKQAAAVKEKLDTERHNATNKSIKESKTAITDLTTVIQKKKDDDALEETKSLKAEIAEYKGGSKEKSMENRKLIFYICGAVLVVILTRHLGDIVKMLSGG